MRAFATAAFFTGLSNAINLDMILDQILVKNNEQKILDPNNPNLDITEKEFLKLARGGDYGCWCYFGDNDHHKARGNPVTPLDRICKRLHQNYECAYMDRHVDVVQGRAKSECEPWKTSYVPHTTTIDGSGDTSGHTLAEQCQINNALRGDCAVQTCIIEGQFAADFVNMVQTGTLKGVRNKSGQENFFLRGIRRTVYTHVFGNFNHEDYLAETTTGGNGEGNGTGIDSCCGEFPSRFPFSSGRKQCCGNKKSYFPSVQECCDGDLKSIGSC